MAINKITLLRCVSAIVANGCFSTRVVYNNSASGNVVQRIVGIFNRTEHTTHELVIRFFLR
jgi:hypothetical protein